MAQGSTMGTSLAHWVLSLYGMGHTMGAFKVTPSGVTRTYHL
jgi:hypothetical protein